MNTIEALRRAIGLGLIGGLPPVDSAEARALLSALDNNVFTSAPDSDFVSANSEHFWSRRDDGTRRLTSNGKYVAEVYAALRDAEARAEQPPPIPGGEPVWPMVLADLDAEEQRYREEEGDEIAPLLDQLRRDMEARDSVGREKYNMPLTTRNGHDAGRDAYEEALDLVVYSRQRLAETPKDHPRYDRHLRAFLASLDRAVHECCLRYEVTT